MHLLRFVFLNGLSFITSVSGAHRVCKLCKCSANDIPTLKKIGGENGPIYSEPAIKAEKRWTFNKMAAEVCGGYPEEALLD